MAVSDAQDDTKSRRDFLYVATTVFGTVGTAIAAWPFIDQMNPSADVMAMASIEVDVSGIAEGMSVKVSWRGQPVFIRHRTQAEIDEARAVPLEVLKHPEPDEDRVYSETPQWLVMVGVCTHFGCIPIGGRGNFGGWFCPCHGSEFDTSGRIRVGPAPTNMAIPPWEFVSDNVIRIG